MVSHLGDGRWFDADEERWRDSQGRAIGWIDFHAYSGAMKRTRVKSATAHLNHDPTDNRFSNLKVLCQRRHLLHD
jgi:hypothetical protein